MHRPLPLLELLLLLYVMASWTCGAAQVQQRDAVCDDSFSFFNASRASRSITHCKHLKTLGAEFGWRYAGTGAGNHTGYNATMDVVFSAKPPSAGGWVAWGINPGPRPGMVGTRALVAFSHANGTMAVYTYNVTADTKSRCKLEPSEVEVKVTGARAEYNGSTGAITMWATLGLPLEYNVSRLNQVWQVGPRVAGDVPKKHAQRLENFDSVEAIDLTSGSDFDGDYLRVKLRSVHGILSVLGWGILLPVGVIVARYFKEQPLEIWFRAHAGVQISAFLVGTCAWSIGLFLVSGNLHFRAFNAHRIIGIFVFSLAALQVTALWLKPRILDKERKCWNIFHHATGYILLVLIVVNIFKGFAILRPPTMWRWIYIAILCLLSSIALPFEITFWVKFSMKHTKQIMMLIHKYINNLSNIISTFYHNNAINCS